MIDFSDTRPLADFQRNAERHIRALKKSGKPQLLTVNGREEVVVQDAASYRKLMEALEESQAVAGIRRGLQSMRRGAGRPMRETLEALGRKHQIDLRSAK